MSGLNTSCQVLADLSWLSNLCAVCTADLEAKKMEKKGKIYLYTERKFKRSSLLTYLLIFKVQCILYVIKKTYLSTISMWGT